MKSDPLNKVVDIISRLLVIILTTFLNVFICFSVAGVVLLQLVANSKEKTLIPLIVACLVAIGVQLYIVFYHKIRTYINQGADSNE